MCIFATILVQILNILVHWIILHIKHHFIHKRVICSEVYRFWFCTENLKASELCEVGNWWRYSVNGIGWVWAGDWQCLCDIFLVCWMVRSNTKTLKTYFSVSSSFRVIFYVMIFTNERASAQMLNQKERCTIYLEVSFY